MSSRCNILGVGISPVSLPVCVESITAAIQEKKKGYICVTGVHGVMESQRDARSGAIGRTLRPVRFVG